MMAKLIFQILLFLCSLSLLSVSEGVASPYPIYPNTRTNNCQDRCGDITIPFPFGIGANCSLNEWYEVLCNNSMTQLKKLQLEVLNISLHSDSYDDDATLTVNYPIAYHSGCASTRHEISGPVAFYGSPFYFSSSDNIFVAVGCVKFATLKGSNHSYVGCSTDCSGNGISRHSSCDGSDCCQSALPEDDLQGFSVEFEGKNSSEASGGDKDCHLGFLVNSTWFEPNSTDLYAIRDGGHVPVVLRWGILDADFPTSIGLKKYSSQSDYYYYYYYSESAYCRQMSLNVNTTTFIRCSCGGGFYGNPYIEDGCKDINECEIPFPDGSKRCGGGLHKCKNARGSYRCITILYIIIASCSSPAIGLFLLICLPWCTCTIIKKRRKAKLKSRFFKKITLAWQLSSPEGNVQKGRLFSPKELDRATDHFNDDRILGKGGQGTVYKGMLTDGRIVAVKKLVALNEENVEPIINELVILSQINHRNIVKLLGCCLASEFPLLVYEFIPNGTLYQYLHDQGVSISWESRLRIAIEVAGALFYLHSSASIPIYHRDIKSSNILLDEKYRAKIADFGTSRSIALDQTHLTTLVQGTFGYLDPEYFQTSQFTDKSDVYSFGVVLVELLTGQKPVCSLRVSEGRSLVTYLILSMEENRLFDIVDATILEQGRAEEITTMANLARRCISPKGRERPTMKEVVKELEGIINLVLPASSFEEGKEIKCGRMKTESSGIIDAKFALGGYKTEANAASFSDVCPFLPSKSC